jgi:hypothetical protein
MPANPAHIPSCFHTRSGDAMLHAALCIPQHGRVDSVTHCPGTTSCTQHPPTARPSRRPSFCGFVLDPALRMCVPAIQQHTTMPCARGGRRQTWFDSSTSHAPTAWVTAFPSNRSVRADREGCGEQVAPLRYALSHSPCIAHSTSSLILPIMTARENSLQHVARACVSLNLCVQRRHCNHDPRDMSMSCISLVSQRFPVQFLLMTPRTSLKLLC